MKVLSNTISHILNKNTVSSKTNATKWISIWYSYYQHGKLNISLYYEIIPFCSSNSICNPLCLIWKNYPRGHTAKS